jgi:hypothetical protein
MSRFLHVERANFRRGFLAVFWGHRAAYSATALPRLAAAYTSVASPAMNRRMPSIDAYSFGAWAWAPWPSPVATQGTCKYSSNAKAGIVPPLDGHTSGSLPWASTVSIAVRAIHEAGSVLAGP